MKIISGKFKGRNIPTIKEAEYRPTFGALKEAIFSIISSFCLESNKNYNDFYVLDLFAGTGALGFEALSRGAGFVTFIDIKRRHLNEARDFADHIGANQQIEFINANSLELSSMKKSYDLIFIDPPYNKNMVSAAILELEKQRCLRDNALLIIETSKREDFNYGKNFDLLKSKIYGDSRLSILLYSSQLSSDD